MTATSYPVGAEDWRGRFIYDMAGALARREDLALRVWLPPGPLPPGVVSACSDGDARWLEALQAAGGIAHLLRRSWRGLPSAFGLLRRLRAVYRREAADLVHVNWLQNALPLAGSATPALVTVLGSDFALLRLPGMAALLRRVLAQRRACLAPNAAWMVPELERRFGAVARVQAIPFGVDPAWFDVQRAPQPLRRWLVVSRLTRAKIGPLFEWGAPLFAGGGRELHLFGPMQETMELPPWVIYHGATYPEALREVWFPQACGLLTLSRHDEGRPQVMLEAMASGLPVVASDLGAHRDFVRTGETGWMVDSPEALAEGLARLEDEAENRATGERARAWIRATVGDWDDCAARYAAAYGALLQR